MTEDLVEAPYGPKPEQDLIEDIDRHGITTPLLVRAIRDETGGRILNYEVLEGRRRLLAARMLGLTPVPCNILVGEYNPRVVRVGSHALRRDNAPEEFKSIDDLASRGFTEAEISNATKMPVNKIQRRLKLVHLLPGLLNAFLNDRIGVSVAEACAELDKELQAECEKVLFEQGKLSLKNVRFIKQAWDAEHNPPLGLEDEGQPSPAKVDKRAATLREVADFLDHLYDEEGGDDDASEAILQRLRAWLERQIEDAGGEETAEDR